MKKEILRLQDVTYKKQNMIIFRNMTFNILKGEIMGFIPMNSYGMDELLDVIVNNLPLYYGYVYYQDKCVNSWKEEKHSRNRICLIDSETSLVNGLDVLTNVFTLRGGFGQEILHEKILAMQLQPFIDELGISIDPFMPVEKLPAYKRVMVELLRAIVAGYHLIIIREISTVISEDELGKLFDTMRYYTGKGFTFLYVSYHFEEIQQVCTRAILMSEGSINLIFDKEQIKKGISEDNYIEDVTFEGIRLTLDKKSKWEINGYDKRPCQGEGEIHTKISGIYADYVKNVSFHDIQITKKEGILPFYEEDVTLGNVENVRIDVEEPEDGSQNGEE